MLFLILTFAAGAGAVAESPASAVEVSAALPEGPGPPASGKLTRADVVRLTLEAHPAALASGLRADAARAAVDGDGAYDPLMLELGVAPGTLAMRPGAQLSAGWTLPLWGMRGLARSSATSRADMAAAAERMTRVELAALASIAVDDWLLAVERMAVLDHHLMTIQAARDAVARRVDAGLAPPAAEAMAEMAVLEVLEQRIVARRDLAMAEAALRSLAGVSASELAPDIAPLDGPPGPAETLPSPAVEMATAELAMRAGMAEMARLEGRPMVSPMLSLNTMWPDPMDWAMVGVGVGIPLDGVAIRARYEAAAGEREAAEVQLDAVQREVALGRAQAVAMLQMAEQMEALMRTEAEPLALERARLARTAWEAGQAPIGEWLDAERELLEVRWQIAEARAEKSRAIAMIAMMDGHAAGLPVDAP